MYATRDVTLNPVPPAAWLTLADAKAFMGVSGASDDALITAIVAAACLAIESYCGRPIAERTVTETVWTEEPHGALILSTPAVSALTSLALNGEAQTVGDYVLLKAAGMVRHGEGAAFGAGKWHLVYTAGYAAGSVPTPVIHATKELVRDLYRSKGRVAGIAREAVSDVGEVSYLTEGVYMATGATGQKLPSNVAAYLDPYVLRYTG